LQLHRANRGNFLFSLQRTVGLRLGKEIAKLQQLPNPSGTTHARERDSPFTKVKNKDEIEGGLQISFAVISTKK